MTSGVCRRSVRQYTAMFDTRHVAVADGERRRWRSATRSVSAPGNESVVFGTTQSEVERSHQKGAAVCTPEKTLDNNKKPILKMFKKITK